MDIAMIITAAGMLARRDSWVARGCPTASSGARLGEERRRRGCAPALVRLENQHEDALPQASGPRVRPHGITEDGMSGAGSGRTIGDGSLSAGDGGMPPMHPVPPKPSQPISGRLYGSKRQAQCFVLPGIRHAGRKKTDFAGCIGLPSVHIGVLPNACTWRNAAGRDCP